MIAQMPEFHLPSAATPTPGNAAFAIAKADKIEGMAKGMAVLESFDTQRERLNATLAAERTGLTRAAARRHLLTLAHLGYLETDGSYFWLASKVLRFSGSYLATARLPRVLQPMLNRLAAQAHASFSAVVRDGNEVVIIARSGLEYTHQSASERLAPRTLLAYGMHLGARLPVHATSTGRVLLAALSAAELQAWMQQQASEGGQGGLARLTAHTITDLQQLQAVVQTVRTQDFCWASQEHELGVQALAVPLRNMQGRTVAALNVVPASADWTGPALQQHMLPWLQDAAKELRPLL